MTVIQSTSETRQQRVNQPSYKVAGSPFSVGKSFNALAFRHTDFEAGFDPLIMVDHYTMTGPTFGAHPHAGLSAVSIIFEDSVGKFHNRDSLGNDFDLAPGDLYWLKAGSGVFHDEEPRENATIHGLQIFVNMPNKHKNDEPFSLHYKAEDVPLICEPGVRVRVLLGASNGVQAVPSPSTPLTILDGFLSLTKHFEFVIDEGEGAWIYAVSGTLQLEFGASVMVLKKGTSVSLPAAARDIQVRIINIGLRESHFVVLSGKPLEEPFVQQGPLVAADSRAMAHTIARKDAGLFGAVPENF
ncbi:MAG: pirin family protein [Alteromonadaceae bacterium]|nr:pirin family protein [Alteromonadaceae bacterium]